MTAPRLPAVSEADLIAFVDGRLDAARTAEVAAWLTDNPTENERVTRWRRQTGLLRAALDPVGTEPVPEALHAALRPQARPRWSLPTAAAIAGIVLGVGAGWVVWGAQTPLQARELAEVGLSAHEVFIREVRHPVEVAVDEETHLVNWLSNRIASPLTPPDLSEFGLSLLGGRVVPQDGEAAAMLMYEADDGTRYTLLIARYHEPSTTSLLFAEGRDAGAYYWMDGMLGYVVAGPDDREQLLRVSRAVYEQLS